MYGVGKLARLCNDAIEPLTPGCIGNLSADPIRYPIYLRHVLRRARTNPATAAILTALEAGDPGATGGSFWLGYHHDPGPDN